MGVITRSNIGLKKVMSFHPEENVADLCEKQTFNYRKWPMFSEFTYENI